MGECDGVVRTQVASVCFLMKDQLRERKFTDDGNIYN